MSKLIVDDDFSITKTNNPEPLGELLNFSEEIKKALGNQEIEELVDITPHKKTLLNLGESGYTLSEALAELIDNSIDAIKDNKVLVSVSISPERIEVHDNGLGMPKGVASKVLQLGFSTKLQEDTLGKFGLGLKTACLSLGNRFEIKTSPGFLNEEYNLVFDSKDWLEKGSWSTYPLKIKKNTKPEAYTKIKVERLKVKLTDKELRKLKEEL